jgi:hypothetical protein
VKLSGALDIARHGSYCLGRVALDLAQLLPLISANREQLPTVMLMPGLGDRALSVCSASSRDA